MQFRREVIDLQVGKSYPGRGLATKQPVPVDLALPAAIVAAGHHRLPRLAAMPHGDVAPALVWYGLFPIALHGGMVRLDACRKKIDYGLLEGSPRPRTALPSPCMIEGLKTPHRAKSAFRASVGFPISQ
jgi:hypothetical protein